jgi:tRNA pseudouridine55 synthase
MDGILLADKPKGKTSHDVVALARRSLGERTVGHAGTLDPLATGLLVLGVGKATRILEFMQHDKTYETEFRLGILMDTDDADGDRIGDGPVPSQDELALVLAKFRGEILQRPPRHSAVKVQGRKLYDYARRGQEVQAPDRRVRVDELTVLCYEPPRLRLRIRGSKGLYVRSIARDLGGHVVDLRRTRCGAFGVEEASPDLLPMDVAVAHLPEVRISTQELHYFETGRTLEREVGGLVRVYCGSRFVGIGDRDGPCLRPRKVFGS